LWLCSAAIYKKRRHRLSFFCLYRRLVVGIGLSSPLLMQQNKPGARIGAPGIITGEIVLCSEESHFHTPDE